MTITKPLPTLNNIHVNDENNIVEFLNSNCKTFGAIKHLGSFIDNMKIKNEIGIKSNLQFLVVERKEFQGQNSGKIYNYNSEGIRDIFEINYDLPETFPKNQSETNKFIITSTVETHSCNPTQKCSKCSGTGRCQNCDARGYNTCGSCRGSGKRKVSDGKFANGNTKYKNIACSSCAGSGRKSCTSCRGTAKCYGCGGDGQVTCSRCDGTSFYQTFLEYSNSYKTVLKDFNYSEYSDLVSVIPLTKNKISFDDDLIEWENKNNFVFDNKENALKVNKHSKEFITSYEMLSSIENNQRLGRIHAKFETVPVTIVDYTFEEKEFQLYIVGDENIICFNEIPKKHSYKVNFFKRIMNYFTKKKRQIAFVYVASYMFNSDGSMDEPETKLLDLFLNNIKLKQEEKNSLIADLKRSFSLEEIAPKIKIIRGDLRALVFAWQCVMQDGQINQTEITAFTKLSKLFKVDDDKLEKIKHKATKFAVLKEFEMLEEYFKS
ncbi:MAG: hypothetical protein H7239_03755 [Flavobacterium sp.]|nr:hypothetical protein [Flavobacterium sp.]